MIIVIFYCFMINDWKEKLQRQINRLVSSGLYDGADELYLFVSDVDGNQKEEIDNMINHLPKIKLDYTNKNYGEGYLALSKVDELARSGNNKIFYFHTKGVFNKYKDFENKEIDELKIKGSNCWVEILEHYLIDNWKKCVEKLDDHDCVGVINYGGWWWGNFWWVRSAHIMKNIPFKQHYTGTRWGAEAWLHDSNTDKDNIKIFEFNHFHYDPLYSSIPKYLYDGSVNEDDIKVEITKAEYGYFAQQRDEGRGLACKEIKKIDVTQNCKNALENNNFKLNGLCPHNCLVGVEDPAFGIDKTLRIWFKTNIDPNNEYVISDFASWCFKTS